MSLKMARVVAYLMLAFLGVALVGIGLAHWRWTAYIESDANTDAQEFFEMLFAGGKQNVAVSVGKVSATGFFGAAIKDLAVTALTPDAPLLKVDLITLSPAFSTDGSKFRFVAHGVGRPDSALHGTVRFQSFDIESDRYLKISEASVQIESFSVITLVPLIRHFAGDGAFPKLLDWMTGTFSGAIAHRNGEGSVRLIGNEISMKKIHALLPALAVDEFDLGIDYNSRELIFSKESRIHMANAEFGFRGGLRAKREAGQPLWDLKVELKAIPIVHALAAPVLGCSAEPVSWKTLAGVVSTKVYALSGSLLAPVCEVF